MRSFLLCFLALLVPALPVTAQEPAGKQPADTYASLLAAYNQEYQALSTEARATTDTEARNAIRAKMSALGTTYAARFNEYATKNPEADDVADALVWVVSRTRDLAVIEPALEILARDHAGKESVAQMAVRSLTYSPSPKAEVLIAAVMEKAGSDDLKGKACYALATRLNRRAGHEGDQQAAAEARKTYERALKEFGNEEAKRDLEELTRLGVGIEAPEIEAEDIDGEVFKLSDYRGKVVLIDFWGDW